MRSPAGTTLALALLAALASGVAACGGGESDEDQITEVVRTAATSTAPADCTRLLSRRFVEQTTFERGEAAISSCEEDSADPSNDPDSVEVKSVLVEGDQATVLVSFSGGSFDGQTLELGLVEEGDRWKINEIRDIPNFDLEAFSAAFESQLTTGEESLSAKEAGCVGTQLSQGEPEKVKEVLLGGDATPLVSLIQLCVS